uniref:Der GTPase-activating protein YihI n=1 Tax=Thaumasiovibrio occultus TaxID=1891184 RepID=UPI000B34E760|nr:Der GTPase-activating protein YihI [Thaumasiovibrio occultus]
MTRKKKARKVGSEGPAQYREKSISQLDKEGLARKKARKRKGQQAGARHSAESAKRAQAQTAVKDPRLGSKKPISLVVEAKPHPKSNEAKRQRKVGAAQELEMLENDVQLMALLDRLDNGEKLGAGLQQYVDEKLDRIEQLMDQLGLLDEPEEEKAQPKKPLTDEDRLAQFERFDMDSFDKE